MALPHSYNKYTLILALINAAAVTACGGGGGDSSTPAATTPAAINPTPTLTTPAPVATTLSAKPIVISTVSDFGTANWPDGDTATGGQGNPIAGVTCSSSEVYHVHTHLTIIKDGQPLAIPASIGLVPNCTYSLHTHERNGVIHAEAPALQPFTLGQFFAVWGQPLTTTNVAGLTGQPITVFLNDSTGFRQYTGDPAAIDLNTPHREITIVVGAVPAEIPTFIWDTF
jgi:hypothetical protein